MKAEHGLIHDIKRGSLLETPQEKLRDYKKDIQTYLEPPYIFDLPPSDKKLMPNDPDYHYYMCRPNVNMMPMLKIDSLLLDPAVSMLLSEEEIVILERSRDTIYRIGNSSHDHFPGKEDLAAVRHAIQDAVNALGDAAKVL